MSAFKSILLHVDNSPRMAARLQAANELACQHDARVTALFAAMPLFVKEPQAFENVAGSALMPDLEGRRQQRAGDLFEMTRGEDMPRVTWAEVVREPVLQAFVHQALHVDLLVLGQHDSKRASHDVPAHFPESVVMASGKPAWILAHTGKANATPRVVLIAWKPSKEAARAVSAALPFLLDAQQVHVVCWTRGSGEGHTSGLDIEQYLQAHGVQPMMHRHADEPGDVGMRLLLMAAKVGAQLLVMGCYGHARARELVLGGVTRTVLKLMTIPVLMAH